MEQNKPKCQLVGTDGNIFALMGKASRALKENGMKKEAEKMTNGVFDASSYEEALSIICKYVDAE